MSSPPLVARGSTVSIPLSHTVIRQASHCAFRIGRQQEDDMEGRKRSIRVVVRLAAALVSAAVVAGAEQSNAKTGLESLPAAARGSISARLGQDLPAYRVRVTSSGLEAQNAKKTLKADFTASGVTFDASGATWGMALRGIGYGEGLKPVNSARPRQVGANRVEYRRGSVTEWYVNGPMGVEQGFTIGKRPDEANGQGLTMELGLSGSLDANAHKGKTELTLSDGQSKLRYAGLSARDASGKELAATLEVQGQRLLLKADDARARYPVTIDPFVQLAELTASDGGENDGLGTSVAVSGNTVAVGASGNINVGAVYIFVKPASGWQNMTQTATLTESDGAPGDGFGDAVSISGNTVMAGAPYANVDQGAAYVFVEPVGGWVSTTETAKLTASDSTEFGGAIATNGSTAIVGAFAWNQAEGEVYVFLKPTMGWQTTSAFAAILTASHGMSGDELGSSVSISGSTVAAGAPGKAGEKGVVYVFVEPENGWVDATETARLSASDSVLDEFLGSSVSISGNTVAAGARGDKVRGQVNQGAAYVFVEPAGGWQNMTQTAKLTASDGSSQDQLGVSISLSANTVVSGAAQDDGGPGKAYVFAEPAGGWRNMTQTAELTAADGVANNYFGASVSLSGKTVAVGAPLTTVSGNANQGTAYVFGP
jgi:hypothetical protein